MARRRRKLCLWLVLLAEIVLTALPMAARAEDAENPSRTVMRSAFELAPESAEVPLYLDTRVNGRLAGLASFTLRGEDLWATAVTLQHLGLVIDGDAEQAVRLAGVPG